jgi:hypothetical protein
VIFDLLLAVVVVVVMVREVIVVLMTKLNVAAVDLILDLMLALIVISVVVSGCLSHAVYKSRLLLYPDPEVLILGPLFRSAEQAYFEFRAWPQSQTLLIQIRVGKCK